MWRFVIAGLLVAHGLVHMLGFVAVWDLAQIEGLTGEPTVALEPAVMRAAGLLWLAALVALVAAGLGLLLGRRWWRPLALAGAAVSAVAVILWWNDAQFGMIANVLVVVTVLLAPRLNWLPS